MIYCQNEFLFKFIAWLGGVLEMVLILAVLFVVTPGFPTLKQVEFFGAGISVFRKPVGINTF